MREQMVVFKIEPDGIWRGGDPLWKLYYRFAGYELVHEMFWVAPDEIAAFTQMKESRLPRYDVVLGGE